MIAVVFSFASAAQTAEAKTYVTAGVGMGELLHAEFGGFVAPRTTLDASWGFVIFNHLVGLGGTQYFALGGPSDEFPKHALLASGRFRLNPTLGEPKLVGSGETIAAIDKYEITEKVSYISTGGGAFLEYVQGAVLPAVEILERRASDG